MVAIIKNEIKYYPMSLNTSRAKLNLEVLPLRYFSKGLV